MSRYIIKRLLWMIPVIVGVAVLIFTIMFFVPGDPAEIIMGTHATARELEECRERLGLNEPYLIQLLQYLKSIFLQFDFGTSYIDGRSVTQSLMERLPRTVALTLGSMSLSVTFGVLLGIIAAIKQNKLGDRVAMVVALLGVSMPGFWLALMLVVLFSLTLGWLPSFGIGGVQYYILPCVANCMGSLAMLARQSRSSMLEVIRADYVTTARAKGVQKRNVTLRHALPNALIPIITVAGSSLANGLAGAMVIESVFSIPGIGLYMINAINSRDYPAVRGSVILVAILFSFVMLLVDLIFASVDPRIKAKYVSASKRRKKKWFSSPQQAQG